MFADTLQEAADLIWSFPVVGLCLLGAVFFTAQLGFVQIRAFPHALALLRGTYDRDDETGTLTHFQALMAALSGTIGIGNIGGVAIAIAVGGPGAVLWMWVLGLFAMATKFVECTLATKYRTIDPETGAVRGGPMYYIEQALGPKFRPLALFYAITVAVAGFGFACMFQTNQAASALESGLNVPPWVTGCAMVLLGGITIVGGIKRIGATAAKVVPLMCGVYLLGAAVICAFNIEHVGSALALIIEDGFSGRAVLGGSITAVILAGVRRAVFSNEAGLGSAAMAHATVKTDHPVREGIVASLGPFIDTIVVSTATAMVILLGGRFGADADAPVPVVFAQIESNEAGDPPTTWRFDATVEADALTDVHGVRLSHRVERGALRVEIHDITDGEERPLARGSIGGGPSADAPLRGCDFETSAARRCTLGLILDPAEHPGARTLRVQVSSVTGDTSASVSQVELVRPVQGIALTASAFDEELPGFGTWFIPIAGFFFAFSTMVTWSFYGETATVYLVGNRGVRPYRILFVSLAYVGATQSLGVVISFSDAMVGLLVIPNTIALLLLSGRVREMAKDYFAALRRGDFDPGSRDDS